MLETRRANRNPLPPTAAAHPKAKAKPAKVTDAKAIGRRVSARNALVIRPGARFTCHADGLCCSSIHALGPVGGKELIDVRRLSRKATTYEPIFRAHMMTITQDQHCMFLMPNMLCKVHAELGMEKKPATCRKFPFALSATPEGRRVVTSHRCPCRTMGEGAPLTPESVDKDIRIDGQPLRSERQVPTRIPLEKGKRVSFAEWRKLEQKLLDRLAAGEDPAAVVGEKPFPRLRNRTWKQVANDLGERDDESYFDIFREWVADAVRHCTEGVRMPGRPRPWSKYYDISEKRAKVVRSQREIINDWLSDDIWSFEWTDNGNFKRARMDWASKIEIILAISNHMRRRGTRHDRATAEAIMMVDAVCTSEHWEDAIKRLPA